MASLSSTNKNDRSGGGINHNNSNNDDDDNHNSNEGGKKENPIIATGLDVAAICQIVTQPSNSKEHELVHSLLSYIQDTGGPNGILQRERKRKSINSGSASEDDDDAAAIEIQHDSLRRGTKREKITITIASSSSLPALPVLDSELKLQLKLKFEELPKPALIHVFNYLTNDELMNVSVVSKFEHTILCGDDDDNHIVDDGNDRCGPGMETQIIPRIEFSPSKNDHFDKLINRNIGRVDRMVHKLNQRRTRNTIVFQRYRVLKIIDFHRFGYRDKEALERSAQAMPLQGIVSLDISLSHYVQLDDAAIGVYRMYLLFLPNLRNINLTNVGFQYRVLAASSFARNCPRLEKITWNGFKWSESQISIDGEDMADFNHLKEIYMNDCVFVNNEDSQAIWDMNGNPNIFIFHKCSKSLERVSIKNARYASGDYFNGESICLPQRALIKFIRNAPSSLKWFRSDLGQENINMLRMERPDIEFVS